MRKIFPYTITVLLAASSANGMLAITQGTSVQKASLEYLNSPGICQESENPLNQIEEACSYVSTLFPNGVPPIDQTMGIQQDSQVCLEIKKIERALDRAEDKFMQALTLPESELEKATDKICRIVLIIDELNEKKVKLEILDADELINECLNIRDEKKRIILPFLSKVYCSKDSKTIYKNFIYDNSKKFFNDFPKHLITLAEKEMDKYNYLKQIRQEIFKNKNYWQKAYYYMSNFKSSVDTSDSISNNLETVKWNARWYETDGYKVELNNPKYSQSVYDLVEHSKKCSEFLKQENIQ